MRHPVLLAALALLLGAAAAARAGDWHDNVDLPFVDDPAVLGQWISVDLVATPDQFVPGTQRYPDGFYLDAMEFLPGGEMTWSIGSEGARPRPWIVWTKGVVLERNSDQTASRYAIKDIAGSTYMFFE
jgi:bla regulator protein BlaR1